MRISLGLAVSDTASFAVTTPVPPAVLSPRPLVSAVGPTSMRDDSVLNAVTSAIAAATELAGRAPISVTLAHPLSWTRAHTDRVRDRLAGAGLAEVALIDQAQATALAFEERGAPHQHDALVVVAFDPGQAHLVGVRRVDSVAFETQGSPVSVECPAETAFDSAILGLIGDQLDRGLPEPDESDQDVNAALDKLRHAARLAWQRLGEAETTYVEVRLPAVTSLVSVDRAAFLDEVARLMKDSLPHLVSAIRTCAAEAGGANAILLTGAGAPVPLLVGLLAAEFDVPVVATDPRRGAALGAALAGAWAAPVSTQTDAVDPGSASANTQTDAVDPAAAPPLLIPTGPTSGSARRGSAGVLAPRRDGRRRGWFAPVPWWSAAVAIVAVAMLGGLVVSGALDVTTAGTYTTSGSGGADPVVIGSNTTSAPSPTGTAPGGDSSSQPPVGAGNSPVPDGTKRSTGSTSPGAGSGSGAPSGTEASSSPTPTPTPTLSDPPPSDPPSDPPPSDPPTTDPAP